MSENRFPAVLVAFALLMPVLGAEASDEPRAPFPDARVVQTENLKITPQEYGFIHKDGWSVARIERKEVYAPGTIDRVGEVVDVVIDGEGRVLPLVLEREPLGVFGSRLNMPWSEIAIGADERLVTSSVELSREGLPELSLMSAEHAKPMISWVADDVDIEGAFEASRLLGAEFDTATERRTTLTDMVIGADGTVAVLIVGEDT